jgi:replication factor C subunit 1
MKKALLFSGPPGLGKTTIAHAILKEFGYQVKEYNASDIRSKKLVQENLDKLINISCVEKILDENFKPFGIVMDEVDGMS